LDLNRNNDHPARGRKPSAQPPETFCSTTLLPKSL
jgi:hypothetical protein